MKNALTIDVEDWYQTHDFNFDTKSWHNYEDRIEYSTGTILELLSRHNVHATFFVLGCIAQRHPRLVREIAGNGHEIGSHGGWHSMVGNFTREEFKDDLLFSKHLLEDITGKEVNFFRAPSWSVSSDTLWALQVLEEEGFICDSSIQPFRTPLSGYSGTPVVPFYPVIENRKLKILEFPQTVLKCGKLCIPFAGGLYLRLLPFWFISKALKAVNRKGTGMIYVHPWETDIQQPKLKVNIYARITHYSNLKTTIDKIGKLLDTFEFTPLGELVQGYQYPSFELS